MKQNWQNVNNRWKWGEEYMVGRRVIILLFPVSCMLGNTLDTSFSMMGRAEEREEKLHLHILLEKF